MSGTSGHNFHHCIALSSRIFLLRSESDPGLSDTPGQVAAISSTDPTPDTITGKAWPFSSYQDWLLGSWFLLVLSVVNRSSSGLAAAFKPPADPSGNGSDSPGLNLRTSLLNRLVMMVVRMVVVFMLTALVMVTLR